MLIVGINNSIDEGHGESEGASGLKYQVQYFIIYTVCNYCFIAFLNIYGKLAKNIWTHFTAYNEFVAKRWAKIIRNVELMVLLNNLLIKREVLFCAGNQRNLCGIDRLQ